MFLCGAYSPPWSLNLVCTLRRALERDFGICYVTQRKGLDLGRDYVGEENVEVKYIHCLAKEVAVFRKERAQLISSPMWTLSGWWQLRPV